MWKKLISFLLALVVVGIAGYYFGRGHKDESVTALKSRLASYESVTDSLLILRQINDSLTRARIKEVTRWKVRDHVKYINQVIPGEIQVLQGDTVIIFREPQMMELSKSLLELEGLRRQVAIDSGIIDTMRIQMRLQSELTEELLKAKSRGAWKRGFVSGLGTAGVVAIIIVAL